MTHTFESEILAIIDILDNAEQSIQAIKTPEIGALKARITTDLKKHKNALSLQLGNDVDLKETEDKDNKVGGPLKKMMGRDLSPAKPTAHKDAPKKIVQSSQEIELLELRTKIDEIYPRFLITPTDHLMDSLSDIEVRGIAKRAGLPVTETSPTTITAKFIDQIKDAMQKSNEINKAGDTDLVEEEDSDASDDLTVLELKLASLKNAGAHHNTIKAVERQIAELKGNNQNATDGK